MLEIVLIKQIIFISTGFLLSEAFSRKGVRLQVRRGRRSFHFHHSYSGWILTGLSAALLNIYLFAFSQGIIIHHWLRERRIF